MTDLQPTRSDLFSRSFWSGVIGVYALLTAGTIATWVLALVVFRNDVVLLGTAFLAFSLGLRHGIDVDHIAAIDNVTRKLMHEGKRPLTVGFYFACGHSSVIILASLAIFATASAVNQQFVAVRQVGEVISTSTSAFFLLVIAVMNLLILRSVVRTFKRTRESGTCLDNVDLLAAHGGVLTRLFRPIFRLMSSSWHMFPLGFLFGLGFETATEIGLFGISATAAGKGLSIGSMMVFPLLFTAGMLLVDTTDGVLMVGVYGWAFVTPARKLYYNMVITFVSVVVALVVGGIECAGLLKEQLEANGGIWEMVGKLNDNLDSLAFVVIGVFVVSWIGSILFHRLMKMRSSAKIRSLPYGPE
jgi:nickel/cobalt transporter (NiCoT) family protein